MTSPAGGKLTITLARRLPAPRISGASATYRAALPGADLIVTASPLGGAAITVEAAPAASQKLALSRLSFKIATRALAVSVRAGDIRLAGPSGGLEFTGSAAMLRRGPAARSAGTLPATAAGSQPLRQVLSGGQLTFRAHGQVPRASAGRPALITWTISPDTFTASTDTVKSDSSPSFVATQEGCPTAANFGQGFGSPAGNPIGYNFWDSCTGPDHAYYMLGLSSLNPAMQVQQATLQMWQVWSADESCTDTWPVKLYNLGRGSDQINSSTDWNNQPALTGTNWVASQQVTPVHPSCPSSEIDFDVTSIMQDAVTASPIWQNWNFGLDGDETYIAGQGDPGAPCTPESQQNCGYLGIGENPDVIVQFDLIPDVPSYTEENPAPALTPGGANVYGCKSSGPYGWITQLEPDLIATLRSNITGENVGAVFTINDDNATSTNQWTAKSAYLASGDRTDTSVGRDLYNGHQYTWTGVAQVSDSGKDGVDGGPSYYDSAPSAPCTFNVDNVAPAGLTVSSTDFPPSGSTQPGNDAGTSGTFTFTAYDPVPDNGCDPLPCLSSGVSRFLYSLNTPIPETGASYITASANSNGSTATGTLSNLYIGDWGTNVLYVEAEDNAGNVSQPAAYTFYAPWNPDTVVTPGDVNGDGIPDLLATTSSNLDLFPGNTDPDATAVNAGTQSQSPDAGAAWNTYQITHRGSFSQSGVDDLFAHHSSGNDLYIINNNPADLGAAPQFDNYGSNIETISTPPACSASVRPGNCSGYDTTDWSTVTQILAPGDAWTGAPACTSGPAPGCDTSLPSLLTVQNGELWLYQGEFGNALGDPVLLGSSSGSPNWNGMTLIAPGDIAGNLTLWARQNSNGNLYAYTISIGTDGLPTLNPSSPGTPVTATSGTLIPNVSFPSSSYPAIASPGPLDNSSYPGLYVEYTAGNDPAGQSCANGCLYYYPGQSTSGGTSPLTGNWVFIGLLSTKVNQLS